MQDGGEYICEARNSAVDSQGNTIVEKLSKIINIECKRSNPFSFLYIKLSYGTSQPSLEIRILYCEARASRTVQFMYFPTEHYFLIIRSLKEGHDNL